MESSKDLPQGIDFRTKYRKTHASLAWWYTSVFPAIGKLR
jgi:hypothetical protein